MKTLINAGGLVLVLVTLAQGAESRVAKGSDWRALVPAATTKKICDPICELRSQDLAFSLLMEVYRQHQAYRIETDYQLRLQSVAETGGDASPFIIESNTKAMKKLRQFVFGLVTRERELRMAKMETEVANFQSAYSCVRKIDEDYVGEKVVKNLDRQMVQEAIKNLVIISPGTLAKGDALHARTIPATFVLFNPPPGPANSGELVDPCE